MVIKGEVNDPEVTESVPEPGREHDNVDTVTGIRV